MLLRGAHVAALVSFLGTVVFLTLVAPAATAEAAKDAPRLRRSLLRLAGVSAALVLVVGIAWLAVEAAVIAGAGSLAMASKSRSGKIDEPSRLLGPLFGLAPPS